MRKLFFGLPLSLLFILYSCTPKKPKSAIDIAFTQDTLKVGYTYWWPESGPFIGQCADELSLVFTGILTELKKSTDDAGPLYTSQKGMVEINQVFKIKNLGENTYANQKYVQTDCFHESGLNVGDTVLVICYDYNDDYSIPGGKSVLKLGSFEDLLVGSIRTYIDADENPLKLKKDLDLWARQDLGRALEGVIRCRIEAASSETQHSGPHTSEL